MKPVNPWLVAVSVMFATFMEVLDTTVVNVSLPHIAGSLSVTIDEATWALTSYLVANAIILPMTGWLAATFGRKRLLMLSVVGFTAASFLCGLAPKRFRRRTAVRRWASGLSASSWRRFSGRSSAAG
jgi:DHA2 family multidrug resistance protein